MQGDGIISLVKVLGFIAIADDFDLENKDERDLLKAF